MDKNSKIYIAGHNGMVGSSLLRKLRKEGFNNIPTKIVKSGDIMKDAVDYYSKVSEEKSSILNDLNLQKEELKFSDLELIFKDLKSLFKKRGFIINWKELEKHIEK